jgi:hypothetical protein
MTTTIDGNSGVIFPNNSNQAIAGLTTSNPQSGGVIQTVQTTKTNTLTSSSGSYVDVGLTATITPKFNTSKIFVVFNFALGCDTGSANINMRIRNTTTSTTISSDPYNVVRWPSDGQSSYYCQRIQLQHLDSPATTSAITYSIQMYTNAGSFQINMPANTGGFSSPLVSTVTLMEIAA